MFEIAHHKPTKCLFLQYLQLVPGKFLVNKALSICQLHITLFFLRIFRKAKMPHYTWRYQPHIYRAFGMIAAGIILLRSRLESMPDCGHTVCWPSIGRFQQLFSLARQAYARLLQTGVLMMRTEQHADLNLTFLCPSDWPGFRADFLRVLFSLKHRKISRKPPDRTLFFLRESQVARNSGDSSFWP